MSTPHPLAREVEHPAPEHDRVSPWQVWAGLLLAPLAFSLQVVCSYSVASDLCRRGGQPLPFLIAINVATVLIAAVGVFAAWSSWRNTRHEKTGDMQAAADVGEGRTRFLALLGLISSVLLLFAVLVQQSALVFFGPCVGFALPG